MFSFKNCVSLDFSVWWQNLLHRLGAKMSYGINHHSSIITMATHVKVYGYIIDRICCKIYLPRKLLVVFIPRTAQDGDDCCGLHATLGKLCNSDNLSLKGRAVFGKGAGMPRD